MVDVGARQLDRQPQTARCLRFLGRSRRLSGQFFPDGRQILVHRLLQQTELGGIELLAALAIAPALVHRQFVGELIDMHLLGVDQLILCGNLPVTHGHVAHQLLDQGA